MPYLPPFLQISPTIAELFFLISFLAFHFQEFSENIAYRIIIKKKKKNPSFLAYAFTRLREFYIPIV